MIVSENAPRIHTPSFSTIFIRFEDAWRVRSPYEDKAIVNEVARVEAYCKCILNLIQELYDS